MYNTPFSAFSAFFSSSQKRTGEWTGCFKLLLACEIPDTSISHGFTQNTPKSARIHVNQTSHNPTLILQRSYYFRLFSFMSIATHRCISYPLYCNSYTIEPKVCGHLTLRCRSSANQRSDIAELMCKTPLTSALSLVRFCTLQCTIIKRGICIYHCRVRRRNGLDGVSRKSRCWVLQYFSDKTKEHDRRHRVEGF